MPKLSRLVVCLGEVERRACSGPGVFGRGHPAALQTAGSIPFKPQGPVASGKLWRSGFRQERQGKRRR